VKLVSSLAVAACLACPIRGDSAEIYFLLGREPLPGGYEYGRQIGSAVIGISDPDQITHARELITYGLAAGRPFPLVRVRAGHNGINRNYYEPSLPEWSWYPYEVITFSDIILEQISTSPKRLEAQVTGSAQWDSSRPVGFDELTVVRELGATPVYVSAIKNGNRLDIYWATPLTVTVAFTLESSSSLTLPSWQTIAGPFGPGANHWSVDLNKATDGFFRVRLAN